MSRFQNNVIPEHPEITRAELEGGGRESPIIGTCYYCSQSICKGEKHYILDWITCCNEWDCKFEAFTANASKMAAQMADDWDMTHEAVCWYFENYAVKEELE